MEKFEVEKNNIKNERLKIIYIYIISIIIFVIYISRFVSFINLDILVGQTEADLEMRFNLAISIMGVISCILSYNSNRKEEIFIMALMYILFSIDMAMSYTTGYLIDNQNQYFAILTSIIRVLIAYIAVSNLKNIKNLIINNKLKSIIIVTIVGFISIHLETKLMIPYKSNVTAFYNYYNIFLVVLYIVIAMRYFIKSMKNNEYIYSVIGTSALLFSIKAIYDLYYIVEPSIDISIKGDSAIILGCFVYVIGIFIELGETTKKNIILNEQNNLFIRVVNDSKHSNIIICDENYTIKYKNKRASKSLDELDYIDNFNGDIGSKFDVMKLFQGELNLDDVELNILNNGSYKKDIYIRQTNTILDFSIQLIETNNKKFKVITVKDVSAKYELEKALLEYELMKKDEIVKKEFFSNISHELKTPLNIIYSTSQLLDISVDKENFNEIYMKFSPTFNLNCKRMQRLIDNIVDITKLDVGYKTPDYANYNIVNVVEEMTLSVVNYAKTKGIDIIFDTDTEEQYIRCDLDMLERIVLNLISNAIKFSNKDSIILVQIINDSDWLKIKVIDEGIGIDPDIQEKIFDRFVQGDKSMRRKKEGSGIGLSLVKSFVELMEGKVYLKSDGKNGCEFTVLLPNKLVETNDELAKLEYSIDIERVKLELSDIYELYEDRYTNES